MARGWESKSVEAQQSESAGQAGAPHRPRLTPEQQAALRRKEGLELARARVRRDLESATNPRHRDMLNAAIEDLEKQLEKAG